MNKEKAKHKALLDLIESNYARKEPATTETIICSNCGHVDEYSSNEQPWAGFIKPIQTMSDFKTRLIEEQVQLEERLNKLNKFNEAQDVDVVGGDGVHHRIDPVQKDLLMIQAGAMYTYNECLKARLARL